MGDQAGKVSVALPLSYENDLKMEAFPHQNRDDDCHGLMVVHWCIPVLTGMHHMITGGYSIEGFIYWG